MLMAMTAAPRMIPPKNDATLKLTEDAGVGVVVVGNGVVDVFAATML